MVRKYNLENFLEYKHKRNMREIKSANISNLKINVLREKEKYEGGKSQINLGNIFKSENQTF